MLLARMFAKIKITQKHIYKVQIFVASLQLSQGVCTFLWQRDILQGVGLSPLPCSS